MDVEPISQITFKTTSGATFNRNVATLQSFFRWAASIRLISEDPTSGLDRRKDRRTRRQASVQRAIDYTDLEHFWARRDVPLRLKTLTRMLTRPGLGPARSLVWTSRTSTWPNGRAPAPAKVVTRSTCTGQPVRHGCCHGS